MNNRGKEANQAVATSLVGGDVTFVNKIVRDIFGKQIPKLLGKDKICTLYVLVDEADPEGVALIMVNGKGKNVILLAPGANSILLPKDIVKIENELAEAEIILMQLEIPKETVEKVLELAKVNDQKVILDPAPTLDLDDEFLTGIFIITPNEIEASLMIDIGVKDEETASLAADVHFNIGIQNVFITLGATGTYLRSKRVSKLVPTLQVNVIESTDAGDVFNGILTLAIYKLLLLSD